MPIIDHFGIIAPYYDKVFKIKEPVHLINHLNLSKNDYLLDAGGGTGRVSNTLVEYIDRIIVLDISFEMLKEGTANKDLTFVNSQTEVTPFSDDFFDRIMMVDAFHHVNNQKDTLKELWRVLKPGGRLVIEEPDIETFAVKLIAIGEKLAMMRSHFVSPETIRKMLSDLGAVTNIDRNKSIAWIVADKKV